MADAYKLIFDSEPTSFLEPLTEQANKDGEKKMYIEGIFAVSNKINLNNRIYDPNEMQKDIQRFNEEMVKPGRALNELNHPSTPDVDLERACDRTVELRMEDDGTVYGKALVLDTPQGRIQKALISGGTKLGKSSRAMGQITEKNVNGQKQNHVTGLHIVCFDSVHNPSCVSAMVDPLMEQREWIMGKDGDFLLKPFENFQESLQTFPKHSKEDYIVECISKFLEDIKF